jgi:uncharacterized protein (DUF2141 family)
MKQIIWILLICLPFNLQAATLEILIHGIKEPKGNLNIGLYNKKEGFLSTQKQYKGIYQQIYSNTAKYIFTHIPNGIYAVAIFHDSNINHKLDKNFLGIPKEGYGVSNNPKSFMKPTFEQCNFRLKKYKKITIELGYK